MTRRDVSNPLRSRLCVVCDAEACERAGWSVVDCAAACLAGGARFLQVRAKQASSRQLLAMTEAVVRLGAADAALIVVNDRADVARLAGAGGVHVGQNDLAPKAVRAIVGDGAVVGLSTHTPQQIDAALFEPIDYVAVGPVFATSTKVTGYEAIGLGRVSEARGKADARGLPVVAIGGITLDRAAAVIEAGAASVAVIGDLLATGDPEGRVKEYLRRLS